MVSVPLLSKANKYILTHLSNAAAQCNNCNEASWYLVQVSYTPQCHNLHNLYTSGLRPLVYKYVSPLTSMYILYHTTTIMSFYTIIIIWHIMVYNKHVQSFVICRNIVLSVFYHWVILLLRWWTLCLLLSLVTVFTLLNLMLLKAVLKRLYWYNMHDKIPLYPCYFVGCSTQCVCMCTSCLGKV